MLVKSANKSLPDEIRTNTPDESARRDIPIRARTRVAAERGKRIFSKSENRSSLHSRREERRDPPPLAGREDASAGKIPKIPSSTIASPRDSQWII